MQPTASSPPPPAAHAWPPPLRERRVGPLRLRLFAADHPTADIEAAATLVGGVLVAALAALPLAWLARLVPACRFHAWTGWPCATCGITRGIVALGAGQIGPALRANPLLIGGLLLFAGYAAVAAVLWVFRLPRPRLALASRGARVAALLGLVAAVLANWAFLVLDGR